MADLIHGAVVSMLGDCDDVLSMSDHAVEHEVGARTLGMMTGRIPAIYATPRDVPVAIERHIRGKIARGGFACANCAGFGDLGFSLKKIAKKVGKVVKKVAKVAVPITAGIVGGPAGALAAGAALQVLKKKPKSTVSPPFVPDQIPAVDYGGGVLYSPGGAQTAQIVQNPNSVVQPGAATNQPYQPYQPIPFVGGGQSPVSGEYFPATSGGDIPSPVTPTFSAFFERNKVLIAAAGVIGVAALVLAKKGRKK